MNSGELDQQPEAPVAANEAKTGAERRMIAHLNEVGKAAIDLGRDMSDLHKLDPEAYRELEQDYQALAEKIEAMKAKSEVLGH